jgi:hypothetical protein
VAFAKEEKESERDRQMHGWNKEKVIIATGTHLNSVTNANESKLLLLNWTKSLYDASSAPRFARTFSCSLATWVREKRDKSNWINQQNKALRN